MSRLHQIIWIKALRKCVNGKSFQKVVNHLIAVQNMCTVYHLSIKNNRPKL